MFKEFLSLIPKCVTGLTLLYAAIFFKIDNETEMVFVDIKPNIFFVDTLTAMH